MYVPSKTEAVARLFFIVSCAGLLMYILLAFYTFHTAYSSMFRLQNNQEHIQGLPHMDIEIKNDKYQDIKYILLWTSENNSLKLIDEGQIPFITRNCLHTNCYIANDQSYLQNYSDYDSIVFDSTDLCNWKEMKLPETRSERQKYVFHSEISSDYTPVCNISADYYFNWTWSYKLDSDFVSPFLEVKDLEGNVVAPKASVTWQSSMKDLPEDKLELIGEKKKAMAWIVTKCITRNDRIMYAKILRSMLRKNSLVFDIYGCGNLQCPNKGCLALVKEYYFYFAAEDSNSVDYVTKEILTAFDNYAVPIVFGGANYTKFFPEGSYINARSMVVEQLVALVQYIINNPRMYNNYHRWRNYYVITKTERFKGICEICSYLNDDRKFDVASVKKDLRQWWYPGQLFQRCIPKDDDDDPLNVKNSNQAVNNDKGNEQNKSDMDY